MRKKARAKQIQGKEMATAEGLRRKRALEHEKIKIRTVRREEKKRRRYDMKEESEGEASP